MFFFTSRWTSLALPLSWSTFLFAKAYRGSWQWNLPSMKSPHFSPSPFLSLWFNLILYDLICYYSHCTTLSKDAPSEGPTDSKPPILVVPLYVYLAFFAYVCKYEHLWASPRLPENHITIYTMTKWIIKGSLERKSARRCGAKHICKSKC